MRISRLFVGDALTIDTEISLDKSAMHYLQRVLRLKSGATVNLFNGRDNRDYRAKLICSGRNLKARIESSVEVSTLSPLRSEIIQGLGRTDHMDWMIQKTTELGVHRLSLFHAARSQGSADPDRIEKKLKHWRSIAISACEQCGRALLPSIAFFSSQAEAIAATDSVNRLLLDVDGVNLNCTPAESVGHDVAILLGPEGGLDEIEIVCARQAGFQPVSLGPRVLRTETAAIAALTLAQFTLGDLR